jgi:vacuolar-type H+-ATPase subunit H
MTERVSPTVDTAKTEASKVTDTAAQQARVVTHDARDEARSAVDRVQDDLRTRADEEAKKLAQTLHQTSSQLDSMAGAGGPDSSMLTTLSQEGARAAERLASRLELGADTIVADVRSWARRNPGGFLLGAAVGGFLIGRVVRNRPSNGSNGGAAGRTTDMPTSSSAGSMYGTTQPVPPAGDGPMYGA